MTPGTARKPDRRGSRDPYYGTTEWKELRRRALERDGHRCTWIIDGRRCGEPAVIADHIIARRDGGADDLANLRSLCRACDARRHAEKGAGG